ncbi:MAG: S-layer homology domain-containing protein [Oscillospiraceae bacterium]
MKSNLHKLIGAFLAVCLVVAVMTMGAFASEDGSGLETLPPSGSVSPSSSPSTEPETISVSFSVDSTDGSSNRIKDIYVNVNNSTVRLGTDARSYTAAAGSSLSITVVPEDGYEVVATAGTGWTASGNTASTSNLTSTNNGGIHFTVSAKELYDINATVSYAHGMNEYGASISTSPTKAYEGQEVTVTISLSGGQKVYQVSGSNVTLRPVSSSSSRYVQYTFTMPDRDVSINAEIEPATYSVTAGSSLHGTIDIYVGYGKDPSALEYGDWVEVYVRPASGYYLKSLKHNGNSVDVTGNKYEFQITEDTYITAEFSDSLYVETYYSSWNGTVVTYDRYWDKETEFDYGDTVYVEITPKDGYTIDKISITDSVTGKSVSYNESSTEKNVYYFTMPEHPVLVKVEFKEGYSITVADTKYGKIKVSEKNADEDDRITITVEPDYGYQLTWLSIKAKDGTKVSYSEGYTKNTYYFYMPDQDVTISATFSRGTLPFTDVKSTDWFYDAVSFTYNMGIMDGVETNKFSPSTTITRGMVVTMLWRMAGEPYASGTYFDDVSYGRYYTTAVAWSARNNIIEGSGANTFGVNDPITREQLAVILYRYAKYMNYSTTTSSLYGYDDANKVSSWAKDAMGWAVRNGVIGGVTNTTLCPNNTATRAEVAQMFMNFYDFAN